MKLFVSLLISFLVTSCASMYQSQTLIPRMQFPENEYKSLSKSGTAIVRGQAFLKTRGGDVKLAAGNGIILNPYTSYSKEWYEKSYLTNRLMEKPDDRIYRYMLTTTADASGRFIFKNVPAGAYFVTTYVSWEAPTGYNGALQLQGAPVTKLILVGGGEEVDVILTR